jgi:hypothetical protein
MPAPGPLAWVFGPAPASLLTGSQTIITIGLGGASQPTSGSFLVTKGYGGQFTPPSASVPSLRHIDNRFLLFERGIKFGNVPAGNPVFMLQEGIRTFHVNSVETFAMPNSDVIDKSGKNCGAIKFRFRDYRHAPTPGSICVSEYRNVDEFGNTILSFTGKRH